MSQDEFAISQTDLPDEDTEKLAYWQTRCLSAQIEIVNLTRRLLEADQISIKQAKVVARQAERIIQLNNELRTLQAESPWLPIIRKHLNSSTPTGLDKELEALTEWYRDTKNEAALLAQRISEQAALLSEYQGKDNLPLD